MKVNAKCGPGELMECYRKLEEHRKKGFPKKVEKTMGDINERFTSVASQAFNANVMFSTRKVGTFAYEISATSLTKQLITFLEFGAGNPVNSENNAEFKQYMASKYNIGIYAGSWSEMEGHGHTYEAWQNNRGYRQADGSYIFDKHPRRGMYLGMEAARRYLKSMAQRAK